MGKFLKKNHKLIILLLFFLFIIKSFQSCIRQEKIERVKKEKTQLIDSVKKNKNQKILNLKDSLRLQDDSIKVLNFKIQLYKEKASAAEQRAIAVQTTAEKIKSHTTVSIQNEKRDSTFKK